MIKELAKRVDGTIWGMREDMIATSKGTIMCSILGAVRLETHDNQKIYLGKMSDGVDKLVEAWEAV